MDQENNFKILIDEMKVRGFSRNTIELYRYHNQRFSLYTKKSPRDITKHDIEQYLVSLYDKGTASATRHLICAALKFYYENVLKRRFHLKYPKKSHPLSVVLAKEEIVCMIEATENQKHRLLLMLAYGSGLRLGETIKARIEDFDIGRGIFHVKQGKGDKDRFVPLSAIFLKDFFAFIGGKKEGWLFESDHNQGTHITGRTAQAVVKQAIKKAGITKKAHAHSLRTSYATHLIENGTDISYVQKLLGHSKLSTTQAYIRLSSNSILSIKSPLD